MKIKIRKLETVAVVELSGKLMGGPDADTFKDTIRQLIEDGYKNVVVSLKHVPWVNSTGLGILIAAIAQTEGQVGGISTLILWVAGLVGGAFIPAFVLGDFLNTIGKVVPQYWALQAYNNLMIRGQGVGGRHIEMAGLELRHRVDRGE
mgnify:CR=1 FL=1